MQWHLKPADADAVASLVAHLGCPPAIAHLLASRNITTPAAADAFLNPAIDPVSYTHLDVYKRQIQGSNSDAVLVSVDSMTSLRRAYPNYFLDTNLFVEAVKAAIS